MTEAECIHCGEWGEQSLPDRFPHICNRCLFPPRETREDNRADEMPAEMRRHGRSILADLNTALPKQGPSWSRMMNGGS